MVIVIEGTDGSGKQTQTELLFNYLKESGKNVKKQSFPNYDSPSASLVKMYLNGEFGGINALNTKQSSVFFAVDRLATMLQYKDFLSNEGILLFDRYVSSNILHQASKIKDKTERDNFVNWLENFEYNELALPCPDITIFLDLKPSISKKLRENRNLKAGTKKDIHEESEEYLENCYKIGIETAQEKNWEIIKCYENENILTIEEIQNKIRLIVEKKLSCH